MGKKRKFRKQQKQEKKQNSKCDPNKAKPVPYELSVCENAAFVRYYQIQEIVPEGEWDSFYKTLQQTLPTVFRVSGHRRQALELMRIIRSDFFSKIMHVGVDGQEIDPPKCISWYPDGLAWQLNLTRRMIRASCSLKRLHSFLVTETESGNISRQEAVSMVPPLLLDIQPHHKILDMCAAPGSKTSQIIEYLHRDDTRPTPDGYVVANDKDNKRCYMMVHQVKRLQSPCVMIINHDATILPTLISHSPETGKREFVVFDRVLADVPCSGDGTLRKNQELWVKWNPGLGINLHGLQCRILHRGLELLAQGGRLVYSTCSFNPIEDEAVVASTLLKCQGSVRLVDVSKELPGLQSVEGKTTWKVVTKKEEVYERYSDVPSTHQAFLKESMFPPTIDDVAGLNLHYCKRILPHHQDTSGFFIAVLEKVARLPWMKGHVTEVSDELKVNSGMMSESDALVTEISQMSDVCENDAKNVMTTTNEKTIRDVADNARPNEKIETSDIISVKEADDVTDIKETGLSLEAKSEETGLSLEAKSEETGLSLEAKSEETGLSLEAKSEETGLSLEAKSEETGLSLEAKSEETGLSLEAKSEIEKSDTESSEKDGVPPKKPRLFGYREQPFLFFSDSDPLWPSIRDFFQVKPEFKADQLMYRCEGASKRNLYYVSDRIKLLVQGNVNRVKFINMGVKVFGRSPSPVVPQCDFRLSQEGLGSIVSFLDGRHISVTRDDIITMMTCENPLFSSLHPNTWTSLEEICPGSVMFHFSPSECDPCPDCDITFCGWRGKTSVRPFVSKNDAQHYLRLCHTLPDPTGYMKLM